MSARPLAPISDGRRAQLGLCPRGALRPTSLRGFDALRLGLLLGEGAGAQVFLATLPGDDRRFAAKILRPDPPPGSVESLEHEAEALRHLDHTAVVALLGRGTVEGRAALALEYVPGVTLLRALGALRDPLGLRSTRGDRFYLLRALLSVARGLAEVHERGWVHLDLKPANVMIRPEGRGVLIDWGLAHRDEARVLGLRPHRSGRIAGTPGYMAPEQIRGERPSAASDQFSLGLLLFEAMTLRPAVLGWTPRERMARTVQEEPPDPRLIAPSGWLSEPLTEVVRRALRPLPRDRHPDLTTLADALQDALDEPPSSH